MLMIQLPGSFTPKGFSYLAVLGLVSPTSSGHRVISLKGGINRGFKPHALFDFTTPRACSWAFWAHKAGLECGKPLNAFF